MKKELNKKQPDEKWGGDPQFVASVIFPGFDYSALHVAIEHLKTSHAKGDDEALDYWRSVFANVADLVAGTESVDAKTVKYAELVKLYAQGRYQQADEELDAFEEQIFAGRDLIEQGQKQTTVGQAGPEYHPDDPIFHCFLAWSPKP